MIFTRNGKYEETQEYETEISSKYDTAFYQGIAMKHLFERNRAKVTIISEYSKD